VVSVHVFVAVNCPSGAYVIVVPVADKHRFQPNVQLLQHLPQLLHIVAFVFLTSVQQYTAGSRIDFSEIAKKIKIISLLTFGRCQSSRSWYPARSFAQGCSPKFESPWHLSWSQVVGHWSF
jgi:hypothetical protein